MRPDKFTVLSLFSGGMGLDIGIEKTSHFKLLACVEMVPQFCGTIILNRDKGHIIPPGVKVYQSDISDLDPKQVMNDLGLKEGDLDLIIGGPPCQSFSTTGRRQTV